MDENTFRTKKAAHIRNSKKRTEEIYSQPITFNLFSNENLLDFCYFVMFFFFLTAVRYKIIARCMYITFGWDVSNWLHFISWFFFWIIATGMYYWRSAELHNIKLCIAQWLFKNEIIFLLQRFCWSLKIFSLQGSWSKAEGQPPYPLAGQSLKKR